jgi:nucleotide-binding universal stress UspA family protein
VYKKILAPLDGSPLAECTLEHVKEIAKGCNVPEVVFLYVMDISKNEYMVGATDDNKNLSPKIFTQAEDAEKKGAEAYLAKIVNSAKVSGLMAKSVIIQGKPAETIIDFANKNGVDLMVMSTHGRSGVTRFALGSVTDKVIRTVPMPVLVVSPVECRVKM